MSDTIWQLMVTVFWCTMLNLLIVPLLQLLVSSFRLLCYFLFSRIDTPQTLIYIYILLWLYWENLFLLGIYLRIVFPLVFSTASFHITFSYSWLFSSPTFPFYCAPDSAPEFHDATHWLSSIFNFISFSIFTIECLSFSQTIPPSSIPFHQSLLQSYIQYDEPVNLQVDTSISILVIPFLNYNSPLQHLS